jgi:hypothetical protein
VVPSKLYYSIMFLCTLFFVINIFYENLTHNSDGSIPYVLAFKIYLKFLV